ncbi:metallopeptidase TldD-related protein [Peribacillus butanolivorans]|uniref:metallopeptidase TldD-related protein n=1 Tax=Peribacillus butanolivorans TaxID=421767 RepID=UPI00367318F9
MLNKTYKEFDNLILFMQSRNTIMIDSNNINREFSDEKEFSLQVINKDKVENVIYSLNVLLAHTSNQYNVSQKIIQEINKNMEIKNNKIENKILQKIQKWINLANETFNCETKVAIETVINKKILIDTTYSTSYFEENYYIISFNIDKSSVNLISDFQVTELINDDTVENVLDEIINEIKWSNYQKWKIPEFSDNYEVVFNSYSSGLFFHEFIGHFLETDHFIRSSLSKCEKRVLSKNLNVYENYNISQTFDDNGDPIIKNIHLIYNGEIINLLSSRWDNQNFKNSGNGRRGNLKLPVITRMRDMYIQPGLNSEGYYLKDIKKGIYIHKIGMGEVNIFSGDFSVEVSQGSLIESGQITKPLQPFYLYLDINKFLDKEIIVCSNSGEYNSLCGKKGSTVKVKYKSPSIIIKGLGDAIHE